MFYLSVPNTYELESLDLISDYIYPLFIEGKVVLYGDTYDVTATWLNYVVEEELMDFQVPSKKTHYYLFVLSGNASQLPSKIQTPGSLALIDGYKLVAINPTQPQSTPEPLLTADSILFSQNYEVENQVSRKLISIDNCSGSADLKQEYTETYVREINDRTKDELGSEIPATDWGKFIREIEWHYAMSENQVASQSIELIAAPGQYMEFTIIGIQVWEYGKVLVVTNGVENSAFYRILKNQTLEIVKSEQKTCP